MALSRPAYLWSLKMLNFHFVRDICKTKLLKIHSVLQQNEAMNHIVTH